MRDFMHSIEVHSYFPAFAQHQIPDADESFTSPRVHANVAPSSVQHSTGDFHQSIPLRGQHEGSVLIVMGELNGGGRRTSDAVSEIASIISELAEDFSGPGALLAQLNNRISKRHGGWVSGETASCLAFFLEPDGNCTVASAGRSWPIINGRELALEKGLPLGFLNDTEFPERRITLREYAVSANVQIEIASPGAFNRAQRS